jgi:2OG-Fe(II) oxygenase superfamily
MNDFSTIAAQTAVTDMSWPPHRTVAVMPGSLPMGGVVPMTPIHAFETSPPPLILGAQPTLQPKRRDIELAGQLAFEIDDVVTADEADAIIIASERFGYRDEAPGISTPPGMRMNKSVHWVADEALMGPMLARIRHLLPATIDGAVLNERFSHRLNMYRYDANDVFNRHTDGDWPGYGLNADRSKMLEWPDLRSCLTMLLYLNGPDDGVQGGSTRLFSRDNHWVDVTPKKGAALFFRHGFGPHSVVHEGCRVSGAVSKYVARVNVMYSK